MTSSAVTSVLPSIEELGQFFEHARPEKSEFIVTTMMDKQFQGKFEDYAEDGWCNVVLVGKEVPAEGLSKNPHATPAKRMMFVNMQRKLEQDSGKMTMSRVSDIGSIIWSVVSIDGLRNESFAAIPTMIPSALKPIIVSYMDVMDYIPHPSQSPDRRTDMKRIPQHPTYAEPAEWMTESLDSSATSA